MTTDAPSRPRTRWILPVLTIAAVALAAIALVYWRHERGRANHAAARNVVVSRDTHQLQPKVAAARANVAVGRRQMHAYAPQTRTLLSLLDELGTNHAQMSTAIHDQGVASTAIVDAVAARDWVTYNGLAHRYSDGAHTVNGVAATERNLQRSLARTTCGDQCPPASPAADLPGDGARQPA